jgi:hypothetical protein
MILAIILKRKIGTFLDEEFYHSLFRTLFPSLIMWGGLALVGYIMPWGNAAPFQTRLSFLAVSIVVGLAAFLTVSFLVKNPEMMMLTGAVKRRIRYRNVK